MQETTNYNLKKYVASDTGSFINGYNPSMDIIDEQLKLNSNSIERALSVAAAAGSPDMVASVDDMTDDTKIYILSTNAHIYYYDGTQFVDSGKTFGDTVNSLNLLGYIFSNNTSISAIDDLNDCTNTGFYWLDAFNYNEDYIVENVPNNYITHGVLLVLSYNSGMIYQIIFGNDDADNATTSRTVYQRSYYGNTWRPWVKIGSHELQSLINAKGSFSDLPTRLSRYIDYTNRNELTPTNLNVTKLAEVDVAVSGSINAADWAEYDPLPINQNGYLIHILPTGNVTYALEFFISYGTTKDIYYRVLNLLNDTVHFNWQHVFNADEFAKGTFSSLTNRLFYNIKSKNLATLTPANLGVSHFYEINEPIWGSVNVAEWVNETFPVSANGYLYHLLPQSTSAFALEIFFSYDDKFSGAWYRVDNLNTDTVYRDWQPLSPSDNKVPRLNGKYFAFGDSITRGYTGHGSANSYAVVAAKILGLTISNFGVDGTGWLTNYNSAASGTGSAYIQNTDFSECDLCTIMFGVNDYSNASVTLNDIKSEMVDCIEHILGDNPLCRIILITPINKYSVGSESTDWAINYSQQNFTLSELRDLYEEVCATYHIPLIDLLADAPANKITHSTFYYDSLHPGSQDSYNLMGSIVAGYIDSLYKPIYLH